jgi:hypothetical protein
MFKMLIVLKTPEANIGWEGPYFFLLREAQT